MKQIFEDRNQLDKDENIQFKENKREYLDGLRNNPSKYRYTYAAFYQLGELEKQKGKDVKDWSKNELVEFANNLELREYLNFSRYISLYLEYHGENDNANAVKSLEKNLAEKFKRLKKREMLSHDDYINLLNDISSNYIYDRKSCYIASMLIMLYNGVNLQDIWKITRDNIADVVHEELNDNMIDMILKSLELEKYNENTNKVFSKNNPNIICKAFTYDKDYKTMHQYYLRKFNSYMQDYGYDELYNLSPKSIKTSGALYFIGKECSAFNIDLKEEVYSKHSTNRKKLLLEICNKYGMQWDNIKKQYTQEIIEISNK